MDEIINKVAASGIVTINLEDYYPPEEMVLFDIKPFLYQELILKEKEFRESLKNHPWEQYKNKLIAVTCSADAIVPVWAYMLVASYLEPVAKKIFFGTMEELAQAATEENISRINPENFKNARIVIKGCGDKKISPSAYIKITTMLKPVVKSIMYGEPCSTVPVYKLPK